MNVQNATIEKTETEQHQPYELHQQDREHDLLDVHAPTGALAWIESHNGTIDSGWCDDAEALRTTDEEQCVIWRVVIDPDSTLDRIVRGVPRTLARTMDVAADLYMLRRTVRDLRDDLAGVQKTAAAALGSPAVDVYAPPDAVAWVEGRIGALDGSWYDELDEARRAEDRGEAVYYTEVGDEGERVVRGVPAVLARTLQLATDLAAPARRSWRGAASRRLWRGARGDGRA